MALVVVASRRPLWYDELFSWYVVNLDSYGSVLRALLAGADNGPPIDYLLRHTAIRTLGPSVLSFRFVSIISFLTTSVGIWLFVRRNTSRLAAWSAMVLLPGTLAWHYASEGRSYSLMLAMGVLALVAWQRVHASRHAWPSLLLLTLALASSPLIHFYGVLNYLPILGAEGWRSWRRRQVDWPVYICVGASAFSLVAMLPFTRTAAEMRRAFWASNFGIDTAFESYAVLLSSALVPVLLIAALPFFRLVLREERRESLPKSEEVVGASIAALTPLFILILAMLYTNAMTHRYALLTSVGLTVLVGFGVYTLERFLRIMGVAAFLAICVWSAYTVWWSVPGKDAGRIDQRLLQFIRQTSDVVAVDNPQRYLVTQYQLPETERAKLVYPYDRKASRRHLGFDNNEIAIPGLMQVAPLNTEPYEEFVARENSFHVLVDRRRYWLMKQLSEDGFELAAVDSFGDLKLYRVQLPGDHRELRD